MRTKSGGAPASKSRGGSKKAAAARQKNGKIASTKKVSARHKANYAKNAQPVAKSRSKNLKAVAMENAATEFRKIVNISPLQLERWLDTPDSKKLGRNDSVGDKIVGGYPGRMVLKILKKRGDKYSLEDFENMQAVTGEINRRLAKRPKGDIIASNWRYSLMNWGHDPSKPLRRIRGGNGNDN